MARGGTATSLGLLERARADAAGAWRRLVSLYRPLVLFWCCRAGVPADDAEDRPARQHLVQARRHPRGGFAQKRQYGS